MPRLLIEVKTHENDDWELIKSVRNNKRSFKNFQSIKDKLLKSGAHQVHIEIRDENDDPDFQEFYYADGSRTKMF